MGDLFVNGDIADWSSTSHLVRLASSEYYLSERDQRNQASSISSYQAILANYDAVSNTSLHADSLGICSSVDSFITHLVNLTTYLMHRFIRFIGNGLLHLTPFFSTEDLVLQDTNGYLENLEPRSSALHSIPSSNSTCKFEGEGCSPSPILYR